MFVFWETELYTLIKTPTQRSNRQEPTHEGIFFSLFFLWYRWEIISSRT